MFCTQMIVQLAATETSSIDKPNIVLILVDDYGYGDISFEGNTQIRTPNIDRIAEEGTRLTRFYQSAGACAPTRASLLTGRDYPRTGVWGVHWGRDFIRLDENTLGDLLQGAGYKTGVFGKWHSGKTWSYFGWNRGFDTSVHTRLYNYWDTMVIADNKVVYVDGPMTDVVGDRAVAFIEQNRDRPFFCYIPFQAIHEPFNCPPGFFNKYKQAGYSDHVARLYGMIEVLDKNVGKVLDKLDRLGLADDTLVLFMVDDGYSPGFDLSYSNRRMNEKEKAERLQGFGRQLRGSKATIWEGGQISPCYVRWPGTIPARMDLDILSNVTDIYPTLAEVTGAPYPNGQLPVDGMSLLPMLTDSREMNPERIIFDATNLYLLEYDHETCDAPRIRELSAHYKDYKYVRQDTFMYQNGEPQIVENLFDLLNDPMEKRDISGAHPDLTLELRNATLDWFDGIIKTGRAYHEAIFPVGHISEGGTPINLDSRTFTLGTVQRAAPPGFVYHSWTEPGNGLIFDIDVVESGYYQVELVYSKKPDQEGAVFDITAGGSMTTAEIKSPNASSSEPVWLDSGKQELIVRMKSIGLGDAAIETLKLVIVHRNPSDQNGELRKVRVAVTPKSTPAKRMIVKATGPARDFMQGSQADILLINDSENLLIEPIIKEIENVDSISIYVGFEPVVFNAPFQEIIQIKNPGIGRHTVNVVVKDISGNTYTCPVDLVCQKSNPLAY